uniref:Apolipoprotein M n=1 Tax=Oreochromis niloticus TaxID=8128 RepID=I3JIK9_ORENI
MALPVVVFLLALIALGAASAPDCKELVKPFMPEDPKQVFGKWIYVMGAGDPKQYHKALESLKSSWIDLSPTSSDQTVTLRWRDHCFNRCIVGEANATISGIATTFRKNLSDHKGHILQTCSDCLLWTDTFRNGDVTGRYILQFTRTGKIDPKHVEIFKKQVGCLNFPEDYHSYDGKTGQQLSKNLQRQSFNSHRVEILPWEMSYLSAIVFRSSLFLD